MSILSGRGEIDIEIPKTSFAPGETIEGTVILTLNKPVKSNGVFVSLSSSESRSSGSKRVSYTKYWETLPLDVEKEYTASQRFEYPFKFVAPSLTAPVDPFSMAWKYITKDKTPSSKNFKVEAKLEIEQDFDVNKNRDIKITYK